MFCSTCGNPLPVDANFCTGCGTLLNSQNNVESIPVEPASAPVQAPIQQQVIHTAETPNCSNCKEENLPEKFSPMSPWSYFGLQILFTVPIVGFIFLIIFSFNDSNINRRNFARSYWCGLLIIAAILIVFLMFALILGIGVSSTMRF